MALHDLSLSGAKAETVSHVPVDVIKQNIIGGAKIPRNLSARRLNYD